MKTVTSILVPTDFSQVARNAFHYALRLADVLDASIDLLYCIPPSTANPGYGAFTTTISTVLDEEGQRDMDAFIRQGLGDAGREISYPPRINSFVEVGDLRGRIHDQVRQRGHQLLVVGTAGRHDGWDDFLGTHASMLIKDAPCPVLVVPRNVTFHPLNRLCFATDLRDVSTFQAGKLLRALRPFAPGIDFLHVRTDDKEVTEYDLELLREVFHRPGSGLTATFTSRRAEDLVGAIFAYASERDCDLVVMHRPARPWFERLLRKSNTSEAVLRARLPLLILNAGDLTATDTKSSANATTQA